MKKDYKLGTLKSFTIEEGSIHVLAISTDDLFGKADTVLVSKDKKTWIAHEADEFMDAVNNERPIQVS